MLDLLRSFGDILTNIIGFVDSFFNSMFQLIINIPQYVSFISTNLFVLPSVVVPFVTLSVSLYIVFLILGRNS